VPFGLAQLSNREYHAFSRDFSIRSQIERNYQRDFSESVMKEYIPIRLESEKTVFSVSAF
jgi:hypothetical protein